MRDYTFMGMGNLYQATMDVMTAACKRFGADNAELAIGAIRDGLTDGLTGIALEKHVSFETHGKTKATLDDINFIKKLMIAEHAIKKAIEQLSYAIKMEANHVK